MNTLHILSKSTPQTDLVDKKRKSRQHSNIFKELAFDFAVPKEAHLPTCRFFWDFGIFLRLSKLAVGGVVQLDLMQPWFRHWILSENRPRKKLHDDFFVTFLATLTCVIFWGGSGIITRFQRKHWNLHFWQWVSDPQKVTKKLFNPSTIPRDYSAPKFDFLVGVPRQLLLGRSSSNYIHTAHKKRHYTTTKKIET